MARMPIGEVTLISVRLPSMTSMPTNNSPRAQRQVQCLADLALRWGELGGLRRAAADHVGAQIVRRAHTRLTAPANSQRVSRQELVMQVPRDEILA